MSPDQKVSKLFEVAEELDHVRRLILCGALATEAMPADIGMALYALLSEVAKKVAAQADKVRAAR